MNKGDFLHGTGKAVKVSVAGARNLLWLTSKLRDSFNKGVMTPLLGVKYYSLTPEKPTKKK